MYYGNIKKTDVANGPGVRVTLFVSGCTNHCEGCFQPETWDFCYGKPFTQETLEELLHALSPSYIAGLTLLGGEPMEPENQPDVLKILENVRIAYPSKNIWLFSGFTFEQLRDPSSYPFTDSTMQILSLADVLVDGRFVLSERNLSLRFRGSNNQRILDLPSSLSASKPVFWTE